MENNTDTIKTNVKLQNSYRGALFERPENKDNENKPDFTGDVEIEGLKFRISAWHNESKGGNQYLRLSLYAKAEDNAHLL